MESNLSLADRDVHLRSVVKSNLVGFGLSNADIDAITANLTSDLIDVLENFKHLNNETYFNGEF